MSRQGVHRRFPLALLGATALFLTAALITASGPAGSQSLTLAPEQLETDFTGRDFEPMATSDELESIFDPGSKLDAGTVPRAIPAATEGTLPQPGKGTSGAEDVDRNQAGLDRVGG